MLETAKDKK